jgi:Transcription factor WhiB
MIRSRAETGSSWPAAMSAAGCAASSRDPDEWFPDSTDVDAARREAAAAIAICDICLARESCLDRSLRYWEIGQHGIWGGLLPPEREALRRNRGQRGQRGLHGKRLTTGRRS